MTVREQRLADSDNFGEEERDNGDEVAVPLQQGFGYFNRVNDSVLLDGIRARVHEAGYFTDRVTSGRVGVRLSDIVLVVSWESKLVFVSHARPARTSSTSTRGFKASGPLELDISRDELERVTDPQHHEEIRRGFTAPAYRPSLAAWQAIWLGLKRLRPDLAEALRLIEQLRFDETFDPSEGSADEQAFWEKDAVGVALDIAGISFSGVFADLSRGRSEGKSVLRSLCGNTTEDVVISHDVRNFPDYFITEQLPEACEFVQGNHRLAIYNVNRRPAERALGVDLIYHNVTYGAFTFVQYKMLNPGGKGENVAWRYRPDKQFDEEVERMRRARAILSDATSGEPEQYRLSQDPFFLKLCRRQHLKVNAGQLINGIYLDLSFTELVLSAQQVRVLEPGVGVSRWLNRTQFTDLVSRGWLGTRNLSDAQLAAYVDDAASQGKSIVLAAGAARSARAREDAQNGVEVSWDE
jgi:hypothetical protein